MLVLLKRYQLCVKAQLRAQPLGLRPQQRLETILIACLGGHHAEAGRVRPGLSHEVNLGIGEVAGSRDVARLLVAGSVCANRILETERAIDLHGAR